MPLHPASGALKRNTQVLDVHLRWIEDHELVDLARKFDTSAAPGIKGMAWGPYLAVSVFCGVLQSGLQGSLKGVLG